MRTVLLTGGSRGIGAAIAKELISRGCRVIQPTRSELDLARPPSIEKYVASQKELAVDILINNAGVNVLAPVCEIEGPVWHEMLQINLNSALRLIQAFAPGMQRRGWGRILGISSILSLVARPQRSAYSMTKAALNALTRSAAVELGPSGVLVNSLSPGYVDTDLTRKNNLPQEISEISAAIPLRRLAQGDELARVAAFLVSEENTYLTGQNIVVDGGFVCQ